MVYNRLILRGKNRQLSGYGEMHHIVPKCMGGTDDQSNLVKLTPEEHYVAHQLLVKIFPNNEQLIFAAHMMCKGRNNKLYGWLRRKHAVAIASVFSRKGERNTQYGTIWITDGVSNRKIPKDYEMPSGWHAGRTYPPVLGKIEMCEECKRKINAHEWYTRYLDSGLTSIRKFTKISNYPYSHVAFSKMINKYVNQTQ